MRASINAKRFSMPSPESAETAAESFSAPAVRSNSARSSSFNLSVLFSTIRHGLSAAPNSSRTNRTWRSCSSRLGDDASVTCKISAASRTSSSVARNAFTSAVGSPRMKRAHRGIERREHARRRQHTSLRQPVEERRFPGVRISNQRDRGQRDTATFGALQCARLPHVFERFFERGDPPANPPAVKFELLFTGSARADSAAESRKVLALTTETRQQVIQLGQLYLQLAFSRAGVTREDVEDQLRAVDDAAVERAFEIS